MGVGENPHLKPDHEPNPERICAGSVDGVTTTARWTPPVLARGSPCRPCPAAGWAAAGARA